MDPNTALEEIRASLATYRLVGSADEVVKSLVEHFEALDEWLSRGGFLPRAWSRV